MAWVNPNVHLMEHRHEKDPYRYQHCLRRQPVGPHPALRGGGRGVRQCRRGFQLLLPWRDPDRRRRSVQGGLDYAHDSGFYAGTWASTVDFGSEIDNSGPEPVLVKDETSYEVDLYLGYAGSIGDLGYDVGYLYYAYPDTDDADFGEIYGSLSYSYLTAGLAYTVNSQVESGSEFDTGDIYYYAGVDVPFGESGYSGSLYYGYYTFDADSSDYELDYGHWSAGLTKDAGDFGEFGLNLEKADISGNHEWADSNSDDLKLWISWSKSF